LPVACASTIVYGRTMRAWVAVVVGTCLVVVACSSPAGHRDSACVRETDGCVCSFESTNSPAVASCDPAVLPQTTCCEDPGWPSSGSCECLTRAAFCGVVSGYEPGTDGGVGEDACVCSIGPDPRNNAQAVGATCYSNGTVTPGPGLGGCCMFSGDAPGSLGVPTCLCAGGGLHTCGAGGVAVASCSAADLPAPAVGCDQGTMMVASCM
jgi:hypothetical protein